MKNLLNDILHFTVFLTVVLGLLVLISYSSYNDSYPEKINFESKEERSKWFNDILIHDKTNPDNL